MDEQNSNLTSLTNDSDLAAFEGKIKEKLYELQIKRNTLSQTRAKLHEGLLEKYNIERSLEDMKRDSEEVKIQLEVAVQAARRGESERANSREALARQTVQLEATIKDRNILQGQLRNMQVENGDLKRDLDQYEEKLRSHVHLQETCKIKETQWRSYLDTLQSEIKSVEQAQSRMKEMTCSVLSVSKKLIFQIAHKKSIINETFKEKNKIENQLISLSSELERLKREAFKEDSESRNSNIFQLQWKSIHQVMELRLKESEQEILHLEESLSKALATLGQLQKSLNTKDDKIKLLEDELEKLRSNQHQPVNKIEKSPQQIVQIGINDDINRTSSQTQ